MTSSGAYATGRYAVGVCARCGFKEKLNSLVFDGYYTNLRVHRECRDYRHPQERIVKVRDPQTLYRPSPEQADIPPVLVTALQEESQVFLTWVAANPTFSRIENYVVQRAVIVDPDDEPAYFELADLPVVYSPTFLPTTTPTTYGDTGFAPATTYRYRIVAMDVYDREFASNTIDVVTAGP